MSTDTPRTDAEEYPEGEGQSFHVVSSDFARTLEREVAVLTKCHEDNCRSISQLANELGQSRDAERLARVQLDAVRAELAKERARLDWLLNITQPPTIHTSGWPYPDTRGTYGHRFIGRIHYESCEGRPEMTYFKDRAAIDTAMKEDKL